MNIILKYAFLKYTITDKTVTRNMPKTTVDINDIFRIEYKEATKMINGQIKLYYGKLSLDMDFYKKDSETAQEIYKYLNDRISSNSSTIPPEAKKFNRIKTEIEALPFASLWPTKKEFDSLADFIGDDEHIKAFTTGYMNGDSWVILCTNKRVIFFNKELFIGSQMSEIPLEMINSISQSQGLMFGEIHIQDGASTKVIDKVLKTTIQPFIDEVNKHRELVKSTASTQTINNVSSADELLKFKQLLDAGIITEDEFSAKKKQLLGI